MLSQDDLIQITRSKSQEHLSAITQRPDITSDLSRELVSHGDNNVVVNLLRNEKAEIENDTMMEIADRSAKNETMQTAIVDRNNVPKEHPQRLDGSRLEQAAQADPRTNTPMSVPTSSNRWSPR